MVSLLPFDILLIHMIILNDKKVTTKYNVFQNKFQPVDRIAYCAITAEQCKVIRSQDGRRVNKLMEDGHACSKFK